MVVFVMEGVVRKLPSLNIAEVAGEKKETVIWQLIALASEEGVIATNEKKAR